MTTTTVKTIGTGGDYTTLQAWEDASPANLVTSDVVWQGQCFNQEFFSSSAQLLSVSGTTTDATRYKELTTYAGASFVDNASVQTNALRYNASNGAGIRSTYAWSAPVSVNESYFRISKMQISATTAVAFNGGATTGLVMDKCIVENSGTSNEALKTYGACTVKNTLVVGRSTGSLAKLDNGVSVYNCTFARTGSSTSNIFTGAYSTTTLKNCAFFGGATTLASGSSTRTYTTCYTDTASPPSGCTTVAYDTSTGSGFQNITDSTRDFRIKTGSALIDVGTTDSTNAATDIAGTARPSGAAYDVGVWELAAGGGAQTLTPGLFTNTSSFYAPTVAPGSVTLTPARYDNAQTFYAATVANTSGPQTLTPARFDNTGTFYAHTVTPGGVVLQPGILTNSQAFYGAVVTLGGVTLSPGRVNNTNSFYSPTVSPGSVTLTPGLFSNTNGFYGPTVSQAGTQTLAAGLFTNTSAFYAPTVTGGDVSIGTMDADRFDYRRALRIPNAYAPDPSIARMGQRMTRRNRW